MEFLSRGVLCGMSGGVDSSVAACLLMEQGYDVTGCTMRLFENRDAGVEGESSCCSLSDVDDARAVCARLGIRHYVFNFTEEFRTCVMQKFADSYWKGETPSPCIDCNRYMKFARMLQRASELGRNYVATGHYARIEQQGSRYLLKKGMDTTKDQSYFLFHLTQEQMSHYLFPLGSLTKAEVREIAAEHGFVNARKRDSQDICFVPDGDYGAFIERFTGKTCPQGSFVDSQGHILGTHNGHIRYTLGQRKGLNIALGARAYVTEKDPQKNTVTLGGNHELFSSGLIAHDINLVACDSLSEGARLEVRTRHTPRTAIATVRQTDADTLLIEFDEPQRAVTPGQAVVVYDGDTVVCGGTISHAISD